MIYWLTTDFEITLLFLVFLFIYLNLDFVGSTLAASEYGFRYTDLHEAGWMWARILLGALLAFFMEVNYIIFVAVMKV